MPPIFCWAFRILVVMCASVSAKLGQDRMGRGLFGESRKACGKERRKDRRWQLLCYRCPLGPHMCTGAGRHSVRLCTARTIVGEWDHRIVVVSVVHFACVNYLSSGGQQMRIKESESRGCSAGRSMRARWASAACRAANLSLAPLPLLMGHLTFITAETSAATLDFSEGARSRRVT